MSFCWSKLVIILCLRTADTTNLMSSFLVFFFSEDTYTKIDKVEGNDVKIHILDSFDGFTVRKSSRLFFTFILVDYSAMLAWQQLLVVFVSRIEKCILIFLLWLSMN